MKNKTLKVVQGGENMYRESRHHSPDTEQVKSLLADQIVEALDQQKLTVRAAHTLTGMAAADFSRIRSGNLGRFTVDRLIAIAYRLGFRVEVKVTGPQGVQRSESVSDNGVLA